MRRKSPDATESSFKLVVNRGRQLIAASTRRLRRWLRPPRQLKVTRLGWFFLLVTLGLGIAAINTQNNLLYLVLGLMLGLIAASGLLSEMSVRQLSVVTTHPADPVEGQPFLYEIRVTNEKKRLPTFALLVEERTVGGAVVGRAFFFRIGAGETQAKAAEGCWAHRGRLRLVEVRISTRFPFGLFEKGLVIENDEEMIILPDANRAPASWPLPETGRQGERLSGRAGSGAELYALRPWRDGDGVRQIHWRKSAGSAGLQSKVYEQEESPRVVVALIPAASALALDDAVRVAARTVRQLLRRGAQVGLRLAGIEFEPAAGSAHELALLRALALAESGPAPRLHGDEWLIGYATDI